MRERIRRRWPDTGCIVLAVVAGLGGCAQDATRGSKLDGRATEWEGTPPLWDEVGRPGRPEGSNDLDIKRAWIASDAENLRVFLETDPSVEERFAEHGFSGWLGDLYLDVDDDPTTGAAIDGGGSSEEERGYEFRVRLNLGQMSRGGESIAFVSYEIMPAEDGGGFAASGPVARAQSFSTDARIAHGSDGVEMELPLEALGIEGPTDVRLLLTEVANSLESARSVGSATIEG